MKPWILLPVVAVGTFTLMGAVASHHLRNRPMSGNRSVISPDAKRKRVPVVVELFTSEGCSSCPPADALLTRLQEEQPVSGTEIIPLEEHVDYWNYLGWRDPYSTAGFSQRQSEYSQALGLDQVYTPQMVANGRLEFLGSDESRAQAAIARLAHLPMATVQIATAVPANNTKPNVVPLQIKISSLPMVSASESANIFLALTEDHLHSDVAQGENSGRSLDHTGVVRRLTRIGTVSNKDSFQTTVDATLVSDWKREDLHAVVFAQEKTSHRILGAATLSLAP